MREVKEVLLNNRTSLFADLLGACSIAIVFMAGLYLPSLF